MDKVSVIIPVYNVAQYLDECLSSVCNQTYKNLEIIVVDDGSTDGSLRICDHWKLKDRRITVIHKENGGLSSARNAGLDVATGKYVYFFDGDDTIESELIEIAVQYMQEGNDMVAFCYTNIFPNGTSEENLMGLFGSYEFRSEVERADFICSSLLQYKIGWEAWSRIYSREKIEEYHLRFEDNKRIFAEDLYFCLCYCAHCSKIFRVPKCLYNYRRREDSIMGMDSVKLNIGRMNELSKAVLRHFRQYKECNNLVNRYAILHFLIIDNVLSKAINNMCRDWKSFRLMVLNDISDTHFFREQARLLKSHKTELYKVLFDRLSMSAIKEKLSIMQYIVDGCYPAFWLRNRSIYKRSKIDDQINPFFKDLEKEYQQFEKDSYGKRRIFLIGTEDFGNLGDQQIAVSILAYVKSCCKEYEIKEITITEYKKHRTLLLKYLKPTDLILMPGGGNFGDIYRSAQELREDVIQNWPKNRKIIFPQTIYFTETKSGNEYLLKSKEIYTNANNITLFVRDKKSYDLAKKEFSCESYLVPDIVLSSNLQDNTNREERVLLCFRSDREKNISRDSILQIKEFLKVREECVDETDLQLKYHVDKQHRKQELDTAFNLWKSSKMVITDRLHGMIFAAITGTPCIAFGNNHHKVKEAYDWISYLPYIRYVENVEEAIEYIPQLLSIKESKFDNERLQPFYKIIEQIINMN